MNGSTTIHSTAAPITLRLPARVAPTGNSHFSEATCPVALFDFEQEAAATRFYAEPAVEKSGQVGEPLV